MPYSKHAKASPEASAALFAPFGPGEEMVFLPTTKENQEERKDNETQEGQVTEALVEIPLFPRDPGSDFPAGP